MSEPNGLTLKFKIFQKVELIDLCSERLNSQVNEDSCGMCVRAMTYIHLLVYIDICLYFYLQQAEDIVFDYT